MKPKITPANIRAFVQGHLRAFYARYDLLPSHIREQVEIRCELARECLDAGKCKHCGCATPELFFSDKGCSAGCYGPLLKESDWLSRGNPV